MKNALLVLAAVLLILAAAVHGAEPPAPTVTPKQPVVDEPEYPTCAQALDNPTDGQCRAYAASVQYFNETRR